jgi:hypothetical protein
MTIKKVVAKLGEKADPHAFVFEVDRAIREQVIKKIEASPVVKLSETAGPATRGVYILYRRRHLVYAGKALRTTLRRRLAEHAKKISFRDKINLGEMTCRYLTMTSDWWVRAGEDALISHYEPLWNKSGFGSHMPGRGRPGIKTSRWDDEFPKK